jgi:hypothetical protein
LSLLSRFAFAATCCRYRRTISSLEAPAIRRALASKAASIFSLTISLASRRALLPPRISFCFDRQHHQGIEHPTPSNLLVTKVFRLA